VEVINRQRRRDRINDANGIKQVGEDQAAKVPNTANAEDAACIN
jgi:hypothetical protein